MAFVASLPGAVIRGLAVHLPEGLITNEELAGGHPDWDVEKIASKTGIDVRHRVAEGETGLDIAEAAARALLKDGVPAGDGSREQIDPSSIDTLLYCTQSPDYLLPTNACMLQDRLGLPT